MKHRAMGKLNKPASLVRLSNCLSSEAGEHKCALNFYSTLHCRVMPTLEHSSRHSVTSRIQRNSRFLSYLIFSSRHLNATLEKRKTVEKFNTRHSLLCRLRFIAHAQNRPAFHPSQKSQQPLAIGAGTGRALHLQIGEGIYSIQPPLQEPWIFLS